MSQMNISIIGTGGEFTDIFAKYRTVELPHDIPIRVETLDGGMQGGKPSVGFIIELPDENIVVLAQTSVRLFQMAAWVTFAKYGDLTEEARFANTSASRKLSKLAQDWTTGTIHFPSD